MQNTRAMPRVLHVTVFVLHVVHLAISKRGRGCYAGDVGVGAGITSPSSVNTNSDGVAGLEDLGDELARLATGN